MVLALSNAIPLRLSYSFFFPSFDQVINLFTFLGYILSDHNVLLFLLYYQSQDPSHT